MALSSRFSYIQTAAQSSEDEIDAEDVDVLKKLLGSRFKYSNPSKLNFTLGRHDTIHGDDCEQEEEFCMETNWKADFEAALHKNKEKANMEAGKITVNNTGLNFPFDIKKEPSEVCSRENPASEPEMDHLNTIHSTKETNSHEEFEEKFGSDEQSMKQIDSVQQGEDIDTSQVKDENQRGTALKETLSVHTNEHSKSQTILTINKPTDVKRKKTAEVNKTNKTSSTKQGKDIKKVKVYDIKPALSFPLDELLPAGKPNENSKRKANTEEKVGKIHMESSAGCEPQYNAESVGLENCKHIQYSEDNLYSLYDTSHARIEPVYDLNRDIDTVPDELSFPKDPFISIDTISDGSNCPDEYNLGVLRDVVPNQSASLNVFNKLPLSNFLELMKYGNKIAIQKIQTALNEQINKAKKNVEQDNVNEIQESGSFGFYKERNMNVLEETDRTSPKEKSEELLQLFVKQVSALVKTKEDKVKMTSLLQVLKDEVGEKLSGTGFTPPEIDITPTCDEVQSFGADNDDNAKEFFEGRTLLKGGVKPRHIPKTTIYKSGRDDPRDPRQFPPKPNSEHYVKLPEFFESFQNEMKKKLQKIPYNAKDPRCLRMLSDEPDRLKISPDEHLEDLLQIINKPKLGGVSSDCQKDMKLGDSIAILPELDSVNPISVLMTQNHGVSSSNDTCQGGVEQNTIPVIIGHSNNTSPDIEENKRLSVLHDIQTVEDVSHVNQEKSLKPFSKSKETKPSVGVVKPLQMDQGTNKIPGKEVDKVVNTSIFWKGKEKTNPHGYRDENGKVDNAKKKESKCERKKSLSESFREDRKNKMRKADKREQGQDDNRNERNKVNQEHRFPRVDSLSVRSRQYRERQRSLSRSSDDSFGSQSSRNYSGMSNTSRRSHSPRRKASRYRFHGSRESSSDRESNGRPFMDLRESLSTHSRKRYHTVREDSFDKEDKVKHKRQYSHDHEMVISKHYLIDGKVKTKYQDASVLKPKGRIESVKHSNSTQSYKCSLESDHEMDLSDDEIKQEFRMKFLKPKISDGNKRKVGSEAGFSKTDDLVKQTLPKCLYKPVGAKSAKELKQVEEDRKFLEDMKKKILQHESKVTPVASEDAKKTSVGRVKMGERPEEKIEPGGLSYTDMLH